MKSSDRILLTSSPRTIRGPRPAGDREGERRLAAAKLLAKLQECRSWAPDQSRASVLAALRHSLESGTYRMDYQRIARAMLGEIVNEALA